MVSFFTSRIVQENDILHLCTGVDSGFDCIEIIQLKIDFTYQFYAFTYQ